MAKKRTKPVNSLVSGDVLKAIQTRRPLRLFIEKQKKKGNDNNALVIRSKFLRLSPEKRLKYYQKSVDKYIQLLDEKDITDHVQIDGRLFGNLLSRKEQEAYFQSLDAPTKPLRSAAVFYSDAKKHDNDLKGKSWGSLSAEEKKPHMQAFHDAKAEYATQVKNFAENLPERLKAEYLAHLNPSSHINSEENENPRPLPMSQRRKSVQPLPESFKTHASDNPQKLTRSELDDLHKCQPHILYYEKKIPDDEKPTFENSNKKKAYIRSLFNQISDKKRRKFILKSTEKWEKYLQLNPSITENQIPTLHLLLTKQDDIHYYFSSLGLPARPPIGANTLFSSERQESDSQQNWVDLSQTMKDEYIKRLSKLKHEYHENLVEFVENTLPSDYVRLEFFRTVKLVGKEYEAVIKGRVNEKDDGQSKITQYLTPKKKGQNDGNEFDRIKQQLLDTQLDGEQRKLVERLGQLMKKYIEETATKKASSNTKGSTTNSGSVKRNLPDSSDVVIINGDLSSDDHEHDHKKKKKHHRNRVESEEESVVSSSTKNRK